MLNNNLYMCRNLISCLKKKNYYLIYISSDAVYSDSLDKLTEKSKIFPESLWSHAFHERRNVKNNYKQFMHS